MTVAAIEARADPFASARAAPAGHRAAHYQRPFAALDVDDVDDRVVLFRVAVGVAIQHAKAMALVVGERFARRMIVADVPSPIVAVTIADPA